MSNSHSTAAQSTTKASGRVPLLVWQLLLLLSLLLFWHVMTQPGLIPPMMFDNDRQAAFFFGPGYPNPPIDGERSLGALAIAQKSRAVYYA